MQLQRVLLGRLAHSVASEEILHSLPRCSWCAAGLSIPFEELQEGMFYDGAESSQAVLVRWEESQSPGSKPV
jgi:hypothetical protein